MLRLKHKKQSWRMDRKDAAVQDRGPFLSKGGVVTKYYRCQLGVRCRVWRYIIVAKAGAVVE